ncbi:MAG: hypothetical protein ACPGEG_10125, partial [Salibacteraceae bacterium]
EPRTKNQEPRRFLKRFYSVFSFAVISVVVLGQDMIELGPKLTNPYTISNMQAAYNYVFENHSNPYFSYNDITTSHYYVRYLPADETEFTFLKDDSELELFDYPLDHVIINNGTHYHDPSLLEGDITWQYTVVEKDHIFENIQYEILDSIFLPEQILKDNGVTSIDIENQAYDLVEEALFLSDNLDQRSNSASRRSEWNPKGKILAYDDITGTNVPVKGAKVRAKNWFRIVVDYTDVDGEFSCGNWRRLVKYSVKWETKKFDIRNAASFQEYVQGPKSSNPWYCTISSNKSLRHATIHRAADRYFTRNIGGLKRPGVWTRIKFNYKDGDGTGINWGTSWQNFLPGIAAFTTPNIWISGKNDGIYYKTNVVFSTTIHELAHSSHINIMAVGLISYGLVQKKIRESWANAVEWFISDIEYVELGIIDYGNPEVYLQYGSHDHMQKFPNDDPDWDYTPIFIDAVDDYNQDIDQVATNTCPYGGVFNTVHCYLGDAPTNTTAFVLLNHFGYTQTTSNTCPMPGSVVVGSLCRLSPVPPSGFIYNNGFYYQSTKTYTYLGEHPKDDINGYNMVTIESNWLKDIKTDSDFENKLKNNLPANMTTTIIDTYFNFY